MKKIGVVDTMFSRINMGEIALRRLEGLQDQGNEFEVIRRTVPGFKDLAVGARKLFAEEDCDIIVACGMVGGAEVDNVCAHEASQGIMSAQVMVGKHILEVFVHSHEESDPEKFHELTRRRVEGHAENAYWMLFEPEQLVKRAGQGIRQGADNAGPLV